MVCQKNVARLNRAEASFAEDEEYRPNRRVGESLLLRITRSPRARQRSGLEIMYPITLLARAYRAEKRAGG